MNKDSLDKLLEREFEMLPPKLQQAAQYVAGNPKSIALESMRTAAAYAGLQPASMLRLARQLGFDNYESFRDVFREWLSGRDGPFSDRAAALRDRTGGDPKSDLIPEILEAEIRNLTATLNPDTQKQMIAAQRCLAGAERIYVGALRSMFPVAYYFSYVCGMFLNNTTLLTGIGGAFADDLRRIGPGDVFVAFSYDPYTKDIVTATQFVSERGAKIISITDSPISPIASLADVLLTFSTETPSLFPSVLSAMAIAQGLAALLVANSNEESLGELKNSETQLKRFDTYITRKS